MLQAVLGLSVERMASAFLTSSAAMTKRLVRAKAKLAAAGVRFTLPGPEALAERMDPVLDAIYAAFTLARDEGGGGALESEALWLCRLLAELAPDEPEATGLLSLMMFVSARAVGTNATFTPLSRQDPADWDGSRMDEAEALLRAAGRHGRPGRFQLEAAIQAVHADRRRSGLVDWATILLLYDRLVHFAPTIGAQVARAAAAALSGDPKSAIAALDAIDQRRIGAHQPYWATRAYALASTGQAAAAADAYGRAAGLSERPAIRAWLLEQRAALAN
jgi:RNA polymerase sigma-70 factor (ECF subfamily)